MQIVIESLALAAFGDMLRKTQEPLLKKLLRYVMADEARHVAFGVLSLAEYYRELPEAELKDRQEFLVDNTLRAKARVAYLADTTAFYHRLTTLQNLDFFARLGGRRHPSREDCEMALRQVGLPESAFAQRVSELGPGSVRKLGIAAALMKGVPALVLDEPLSGLDPKAAAELVEILEELRDQGKALLITMQDLFWARQLADRVGILQEGRQALTRSREELRFENLEKLYLDYMRGGLRELAAK